MLYLVSCHWYRWYHVTVYSSHSLEVNPLELPVTSPLLDVLEEGKRAFRITAAVPRYLLIDRLALIVICERVSMRSK